MKKHMVWMIMTAVLAILFALFVREGGFETAVIFILAGMAAAQIEIIQEIRKK